MKFSKDFWTFLCIKSLHCLDWSLHWNEQRLTIRICAVCSLSPFIEKYQASHKSRQHFTIKIVFRQSDHSFFLSETFFSFQKKPNYIPIYLIFNITLCVLNMILMTILILHLVQCFPSTLASALHLNNLTYFINAFGIPMHISLNLFFIYTGIFFS